jgi:PhzF family phenazine biosynthesis protein
MVDSFSSRPFTGNPAAVVTLESMPADDWMAAMARETNASDTGFVLPEAGPEADFQLRWFTPEMEVNLCGHATLASAHCLFEDGVRSPIRFATRSGILTVTQEPDGSLAMDFPAQPPSHVPLEADVAAALGLAVEWTGSSPDGFFVLAVVADERTVRAWTADPKAVAKLDAMALILTAVADEGQPHQFVSRLFAPKAGIPEDPVTGSSHTVLAPYWGERLGRASLVGLQASARSGLVAVRLNADRVFVTGRAVTIFDGVIVGAAVPG